ncbi:threonine/serine exporter family protein [Plantibacter sp. ME-Dv--P-095]|uniref:threonine/serine exporter family protein n=1 Tax=Plantibacter sp. ME-Dv--P-095 TaxID=3040299 RepID=UPI00254F8F58|nr:threonine/serine exporter family protein [Plantibacter sp. ME-Dv--P-095]
MSDDAATEEHRRTAAHAYSALGCLLLDAGTSVTDVRDSLERATAASGDEGLAFSVLPQLIIVNDVHTGAVLAVGNTHGELSFRGAARANRLMRELELGHWPVGDLPARVQSIRETPRPHASMHWVVGNLLLAGGLALLFRCPWWAIVASMLVGAFVGLVITLLARWRGAVAIAPFVTAFVSTTLVGTLASAMDLGPVPLFAVCAPIAILVPGALITNALLELTATDIVTGSARLMYGLIVLAFMAAGISAGALLTGLSIDPDSTALVGQLGRGTTDLVGWEAIPPLWFTWIGVVMLAAGIGIAFGSGRSLTLLTICVMALTYAGIVLFAPLVGNAVATGLTAGLVFVVARIVERYSAAVPSNVTFQPALLMLVPGTVGLVSLATLEGSAVTAALTVFISLCVGVKTAAVVTGVVIPPVRPRSAAPAP